MFLGPYTEDLRMYAHTKPCIPVFTTVISILAKMCLVCFVWPCCEACGVLVPRPGVEHMSPALEVWSLNHRTTGKVPIAKTCKQKRCLSIGERISNLWTIHRREYYSVLKRNQLSSHEVIQRKFKH